MKNGKSCIKAILLIAVLAVAFLPSQAFAQSAAVLSGRVMDSSQGVITGAEVTAVNVDTGVEARTTTNESGVYNFPSLPGGTYRISARAAGFLVRTVSDMRLRTGAQASYNFELAVAGITTTVEVSGVAENMILDAGSSTGTVMQEELVSELPLVGNNVMELLNSMGGVIKAEEPIFGASNQSFAGISGGAINVTRDGVSASDIRYNSGVTGNSYINQELVGEFKMILSPVDAELGRGAGQVQVTTRSGGNAFHGSGVWNNQNTALDARKFEDKRQGLTPPWRNLNNYTLTASGPIVKNRTFFFASWDQQIARNKEWRIASALTPCAQKGIYRYYDGVVSINPIDSANYSRFDNTPYPRRVTVTSAEDGTPKLNDKPAGTTGELMYQSVFGPLTAPISDINGSCSDYTLPVGVFANSWDANRNGFDTTGYVSNFLDLQPDANYYGYGDGLNTAAIRWWRTTKGNANIFGTGEDSRRKMFTVKIDHNLSSSHRFSGTYTIEKTAGEDGGAVWPENSYVGTNSREPQSLTLSLTSTLAPTLLNEFRLGYSHVESYVTSPIDMYDGLTNILNDLASGVNLPNYSTDKPIIIDYADLWFGPKVNGMGANPPISSPFGGRGLMNNTWGGKDNSWNFSDTVTWMKGSHSFKGGVGVKINQAWYTQDGGKNGVNYWPVISGGDMLRGASMTFEQNAWNWDGIRPYDSGTGLLPGLSTQNGNQFGVNAPEGQTYVVRNMLNFLAGSVSSIPQAFYVEKDSGGGFRWNRYADEEIYYINDLRSREFNFFFKDDWRITSDLTLNLGVRYEYFGVPWENNGRTAALEGGSSSMQGVAGPTWMNWMGLDYSATAARYQFVGPNSDHSDLRPWNRDTNNFAPHVGFAWQLPWLGRGLTTLRGGYSVSYSPIFNFDNVGGIIAWVPEAAYTYVHDLDGSDGNRQYANLATVGSLIGNNNVIKPPIEAMRQSVNMSGSLSVYDENIRNPYTHSLNLSLTRQLGRAFTVDIRYIGNLTRNLLNGINLNTPKYMSNGLFEEFELLRKNGAATTTAQIPIIAEILRSDPDPVARILRTTGMGWSGNGYQQLADGNYNGLAQNLSRFGASVAGQPGNAIKSSSVLPDNFIITNPELQTATITTNDGYTNYHSMQAQVTMRPLRGLSFQSTYTWSRNITDRGVENYDTGSRRYYLADAHRSHALTTYGSYTLPFGANGFFFRDASGAFRKAIEGWGLSWVASISSGAPMSLTGASSYWGINNPDVVRPDLWDNKGGKAEYVWNPDGTWANATFYGDKYTKVSDPTCDTIATELQARCRTQRGALALKNDISTIVIQNAKPGTIGNMTPNSLTGPGRWTLDMAMSKSVEFMEGKTIDIRIDAANIFNHATPSGTADAFNHAPRYDVINQPQGISLTGTSLGYIATKSGHRTFQGKLSIRF